ncbi:type II toxin-antitoxin system HicA family toxin [Candidatus Parcubacteria bacterium]|nr:MAG: type II toxin-antitoxin system HicA family toxin [Candidatus Parcubacteria bacterium]
MPKLPAISSKDLIKALKSIGFFEHRQSGSHLAMKHNDGRRTIVPIHSNKDIPKGTLFAILKDIQISKEELIKIL